MNLFFRMFDLINDIIDSPIFGQFIITSLHEITFWSYAVSSASTWSNIEIMMNLSQMNNFLLEIFLPCYYGEKVRTAFNDLAQAIYEIEWYDKDVRFQRYFVLFLQRAQRDQFFMAANWIPITLRSFFVVIIELFFIRY